MADSAFRAGGLASGLDSNLIIEKLIELESRPINLVKQRQTGLKTQITKLGEIQSKLTGLNLAAKNLSTGGTVATSVSSTHTGYDVVTGSGAVAGRHTVQVHTLATAAAARSQGFASDTAPVRGGTLAFNVQGTAYNITIADGTSLSNVAAQIRGTGAPVSATVISNGTQSFLSILNNKTGHPLTGVPGDALSLTETSTGTQGQPLSAAITMPATNASVTVDNLLISRTSNSITDIVPGATINLKAQTAAAETMVLVNNSAGTLTNLNKFVDSYNTILKLVQDQLQVSSSGDRGSSLAGDGSLRSLQATLQKFVTTQVGAGTTRSLADIGVKSNRDGSLTVDSATLTKALERDANAVNALFSTATTGLAAVVESKINGFNNISNGLLVSRQKGLSLAVNKLDDQISSMEMRIEQKRTMLINQFTAMEKVVSTMRSTGNFLSSMSNQGTTA